MADGDESKKEKPPTGESPPKLVTLEDLIKGLSPHLVPEIKAPPGAPAEAIRRSRVQLELQVQSDRGAAIIGGAYLESKLEVALKSALSDKALKNKSGKVTARLFSLLFDDYSNAPLGTFSGKIRMAYGLDLIEERIFEDLLVIKDIRNAFAHNFEVKDRPHEGISFETQSIKDTCNHLWIARDDRYAAFKEYREMMDLDKPRGKFIYTVKDISIKLDLSAMIGAAMKSVRPISPP